MSDTQEKAADGNALPVALTFSQFLTMLEDGELHGDLTEELRVINTALNQHVMDHGGTPKATLTLKINITLSGGVFEIKAAKATKLPEEPRGRTVAWGTPNNHFTAANPKQMQMFGVRDVTPAPTEAREV